VPVLHPQALPLSGSTLDRQLDQELQQGLRTEPLLTPLFESAILELIFVDLRRLSKLKAINKFGISNSSNDLSYTDQMYFLQSQLYLSSNSTENVTLIDRCCCLAALIHIHVGLCDMSFEYRAVEILAEKLNKVAREVITPENSFGMLICVRFM
jgi:hypothetical protein